MRFACVWSSLCDLHIHTIHTNRYFCSRATNLLELVPLIIAFIRSYLLHFQATQHHIYVLIYFNLLILVDFMLISFASIRFYELRKDWLGSECVSLIYKYSLLILIDCIAWFRLWFENFVMFICGIKNCKIVITTLSVADSLYFSNYNFYITVLLWVLFVVVPVTVLLYFLIQTCGSNLFRD